MFKKSNPNGPIERIVNNFISLLFLSLFLSIAISLYNQGKYYEFSYLFVFTLLMLCLIFFLNIKPKTKPTNKYGKSKFQLTYNKSLTSTNFSLLYSTKDYILFQRIITILGSQGINYYIFDLQGSSMMNFLSDVEIRIMVRSSDYEHSLKIINEELNISEETNDMGRGETGDSPPIDCR